LFFYTIIFGEQGREYNQSSKTKLLELKYIFAFVLLAAFDTKYFVNNKGSEIAWYFKVNWHKEIGYCV